MAVTTTILDDAGHSLAGGTDSFTLPSSTASSDRLITVIFDPYYAGLVGGFVNSVTIGGVSATQYPNLSGTGFPPSVWYAIVPTGATPSVVVDSFNGSFASIVTVTAGDATAAVVEVYSFFNQSSPGNWVAVTEAGNNLVLYGTGTNSGGSPFITFANVDSQSALLNIGGTIRCTAGLRNSNGREIPAIDTVTYSLSGGLLYGFGIAIGPARDPYAPIYAGIPYTVLNSGTATFRAIGGGAGSVTSSTGGGGGGAYAEANVSLTAGDIIYGSGGAGGTVSAAGGDSWVRKNTNAAPSSTTDGILAKGGSVGAASAGGIGGQASASVGTTKFSGGNGSIFAGSGAGGGAAGELGDGSNASNVTPGSGGPTNGNYNSLTPGDGGANGNNGNDYGGGAGVFAAFSGSNSNGVATVQFDPPPPSSPYFLAAGKGTFSLSGQAAGLLPGPYWTLVGITEAGVNASGNYTIAVPSGVQQNDVLVVDIATRSNVLHSNAAFTFPQTDAGGNTTNNTTASDVSFATGYCIRGASNPSTSFTRTGGSRALGTMRAYRSSIAGTPSFDTSAQLAMTVAGTALTLSGGVTTTAANELLVTGVYGARANTVSNMDGTTEVTGNSGATNTTTPPVQGTWTERSDRNNGTSPTVALACYDTIKRTAGSTGNLTATESQSALHGMTVMAFKHPVPAGGGSYSLTADKGTFTTTGVAATLRTARTLTAATGVRTFTGNSVNFIVGKKVGASLGTFALTGQSANFKRTYVLSSSAGSYSLSGQSANFPRTYVNAAGTGTYTVTGQTAGLRAGKGITAFGGTYTVTGQSANLVYTPASQSYTLTADKGTFSLSGQSVNLSKGFKTAASVGTYAVTGQASVLRIGKKLGSVTGTYLLTGQAATLRRTTNVGFLPGAYNLNGQVVALKVARGTPGGVGTYVLSGKDAILRKTTKAVLSPGSFAITGIPVTLLLNKKVPAALGTYLLSGKDVSFSIGQTGHYQLFAECGLFRIYGKDVNLSYSPKVGGIGLRSAHALKPHKPHYTPPNKHFPPDREKMIHQSATILARSGGHARARNLTPSQRTNIARNAANARWK